jgi:ferrochelatase
LQGHRIALPIYFGNRNWHPFLEDTIVRMRADGVRDVLVFVTSAYSSYSGCRQYREDVMRAVDRLGVTDMRFDKIRVFYNHPGFIAPMARRLRAALASFPADRRDRAAVVFTAHSIPLAMARGCAYERQIGEASRLVAEEAGVSPYQIAWQSRSGPPQSPWLEPDILDVLNELRRQGVADVVVVPVGFISDHLEVLYDLDYEAQERAKALGLTMLRVPAVGTDPEFVAMIRELIEERITANPFRRFLGAYGPSHDVCPINCCQPGQTRPASQVAEERATA